MTKQTPMTIGKAIGEFGAIDGTLPRAAMQWALDHWAEAAPRLVETLSYYANGTDRSKTTSNVVFIAVHLFGEKAESRAFVPLCHLLHDAEATEAAIGDAITSTLRPILARTFDGDMLPLRAVIEDAEADQFIRYSALMAMAYLALIGRIARDELHVYLGDVRQTMRPRGESYVWVAWTECVAMLGFTDLADEAKVLFQREWVDPGVMHYRHFESDLKRALEDPTGTAAIADKHLAPFTSAIDTLSRWYAFSPKRAASIRKEREAARAPRPWSSAADRNPLRHIGRNDPCPCGSGRKFKKCCLGKADLVAPARAA